jgi:hypothetical protein
VTAQSATHAATVDPATGQPTRAGRGEITPHADSTRMPPHGEPEHGGYRFHPGCSN